MLRAIEKAAKRDARHDEMLPAAAARNRQPFQIDAEEAG